MHSNVFLFHSIAISAISVDFCTILNFHFHFYLTVPMRVGNWFFLSLLISSVAWIFECRLCSNFILLLLLFIFADVLLLFDWVTKITKKREKNSCRSGQILWKCLGEDRAIKLTLCKMPHKHRFYLYVYIQQATKLSHHFWALHIFYGVFFLFIHFILFFLLFVFW